MNPALYALPAAAATVWELPGHTCRYEPRSHLTCTYYDSFDGLLHADGQTLVLEDNAGTLQLCRQLLTAVDPVYVATARPPCYARDLPLELRPLLAPVLGQRALLPQVRLRCVRQPLSLLDSHGHTVAQLLIEEQQVLNRDGAAVGQIDTLRVLPVKGQGKALRRVLAYIEQELGLTPPVPLLQRALTLLGYPAPFLSPAHNTDLSGLPALSAAKHILLDLLDTLERNEPGLRAALDVEFLHDYRVALRRTRSLLGRLKQSFDPAALAHFRAGFAWLGQVTGPLRDLDVHLETFDAYRAGLPERVWPDLEPLRAFLRQQQQQAQQQLVATLDRPDYGQLLHDWRQFLESPALPSPDAAPDAEQPITTVAARRIWKAYRQVHQEGRALTPASPDEDFHELRKSCKKLRYLLEFFIGLFPGEPMKILIKSLKNLQNNLGDHQDIVVHQHTLHTHAEEMAAAGCAPPATLLAMGMLIADLETRHCRLRAEFADCFAAFDSPGHHKLFKQLFKA